MVKGTFILIAGLAALAYAQQGQVAGPVTGYVFDPDAHGVRPVLGIPGASVFGDALQFGFDVAFATISPTADSALAVAGDGSVHLVRLGGTPGEVPLNGASVKPDRVVYSPSGTSVALIAAGRALVFTGLPAAPTLKSTMDLPAEVSRPLQMQVAPRPARAAGSRSIAVSDDGDWLLAATETSVQLIGSGGSHAVQHTASAAQVAFAPGSHDVAIADSSAVLILRDITGARAQQPLTPVSGVTGVGFSPDGKTLYVAGGQGVTLFDLAGGTNAAVSCNCNATSLQRMGSVYRLTDLGSGPLWLLDPTAGNPRIVFVPAKI